MDFNEEENQQESPDKTDWAKLASQSATKSGAGNKRRKPSWFNGSSAKRYRRTRKKTVTPKKKMASTKTAIGKFKRGPSKKGIHFWKIIKLYFLILFNSIFFT